MNFFIVSLKQEMRCKLLHEITLTVLVTQLFLILILTRPSHTELFRMHLEMLKVNPVKEIENLKGTVSVIPSDPLCKHVNARFTTVSLKALFETV